MTPENSAVATRLGRITAIFCCTCVLSAVTAKAPTLESNTAANWNDAALRGRRDSKLAAPEASRALAIVSTSMYDAWAAYDDKAVVTQLTGAGTVKTVTDSCPACNGMTQIDNYNTSNACYLSGLGNYQTIRTNR